MMLFESCADPLLSYCPELELKLVSLLPLQPPITVHGIPGRYASALYTSAAKAGKLDEVQAELTEVRR